MTEQTKKCPYCANEIKAEAIKCQHCGEWLEEKPTTSSSSIQNPETLIRQALGDKYEIQSVIGKGGMATVYKALQKNLNRTVALKVIHQNLVHDTEFVSRFIREAQLSASLSHPNIVTVHDVGSIGSVHYMAMELLEGNDLHQKVKQQGALNYNDVVKSMIPIAEALHYIHQKGLIHRDIKSSNILITKQSRPVLMDFGIAHAADGTKLTQTGTVIGTPEYMSPEQAQGHEVDNRSDLYSLGVVMYECLTGQVPFKGDNPLTTINLLTNYEAETPTKVNAKIPDWLSSIVLKLLVKDPKQRFINGKALATALQKKEKVELLYVGSKTQKISTPEKTQTNTNKKAPVKKASKSQALKWAIAIVSMFIATVVIIYITNEKSPKYVRQSSNQQIQQNPDNKSKQSDKNIEEEYKINVVIKGATGFFLIEERDGSNWITKSQANITNGAAVLHGKVNYPTLLYFSIEGEKTKIPIFLENKNISITGNLQSLEDIQIDGSFTHDEYKKIDEKIKNNSKRYMALYEESRAAAEAGNQAKAEALMSEVNELYEKTNTLQYNFIKQNPSSYVAPYFLSQIQYGKEAAELEKLVNNLDPRLHKVKSIANLKERISILKKVAIGKIAPDFTQKDTEGNLVRFSEIYSKNKLTLLDFWASWCGPCRAENPNIVAVYKEHREKGFSVIGVSLDKDKDAWVKGIRDDNLAWVHVSDLQYWDSSVAKLYAVRSIPQSILVDSNGRILAKNKRGPELQKVVSEFFE